MVNTFEKLLEIKTWRTNLWIKAVYIDNISVYGEWRYYLYYYDTAYHTFYINDLDNIYWGIETSAVNTLEHIINKAYNLEMKLFWDAFKDIQMKRKAKVFCIYEQKKTNEIIIDKVQLEHVVDGNGAIVKFKNPKWDSNLENTLKIVGLK